MIAILTWLGWNLSDYIKREARSEYYFHNSRWRLPIVSRLVRAPAAWNCRNGALTQEKPFHLVSASSKTTTMCMARSHSNTIQMILLPSHTTRCARLCMNSSSAQRITCCNYTINIFTPHATLKLVTSFYCLVISIITVACWASSSADFFPLFRSPSIFLFLRSHKFKM